MAALSISRPRLIARAERAIDRAESSGGSIGSFRRARLLKVARTMDAVLLNGWRTESHAGPCGCLVGTLFPDVNERIERDDPTFNAYIGVGRCFNDELMKELGLPTDVWPGTRRIEVRPAAGEAA